MAGTRSFVPTVVADDKENELRERMAKVENLLEGLREAIQRQAGGVAPNRCRSNAAGLLPRTVETAAAEPVRAKL